MMSAEHKDKIKKLLKQCEEQNLMLRDALSTIKPTGGLTLMEAIDLAVEYRMEI